MTKVRNGPNLGCGGAAVHTATLLAWLLVRDGFQHAFKYDPFCGLPIRSSQPYDPVRRRWRQMCQSRYA
jgi:hypothetical protein